MYGRNTKYHPKSMAASSFCRGPNLDLDRSCAHQWIPKLSPARLLYRAIWAVDHQKSSSLELNGRRMNPWIEFQRAHVRTMEGNNQNYEFVFGITTPYIAVYPWPFPSPPMVGAVCNIHTSGATLQRLVSAKKTRSDLALAPFSIFVIVCRCRVVVRAVLVAVIELSLPYALEGIRVSWGLFFFLGLGFFFVCKSKIK